MKIELNNSKEKHIISVQIFTGKSKEVPLPVFMGFLMKYKEFDF